jgi:DNA helicase HerA-like ATPase
MRIKAKKGVIDIGFLTRDEKVKIFLNIDSLLRTHFGIFGYTGAGKSNLLSTLVYKLMTQSDITVKLVLWDLMSEYFGLLIDVLDNKDGYLIAISKETFGQKTLEYLKTMEDTHLESAAKEIVETMIFPSEIKYSEVFPDKVIEVTKSLLKNKKILLLDYIPVVDKVVSDNNPWIGLRSKEKKKLVSEIVGTVFGKYYKKDVPCTPDLAKELKENLEKVLSEDEYKDIRNKFDPLKKALSELAQEKEFYKLSISYDELKNKLNDTSSSSLFIFIGNNDDEIRNFTHILGMDIYTLRKSNGIIDPIISFIFDEADEFIPYDAKGTYENSSEIAKTLARRGRKFGMGIGIATQRIRYLNTSIMAQPHTYFISKLPRKSDREAVAEAFGLGIDMFNQTFKFKKGDWLVVSHDALGLKSIPIPVHFENANQRIINFLKHL